MNDAMADQKTVIIIAGPNGAGKTTFAREYLPIEVGCVNFINADMIAMGLSPFNPDKAAIRAGRIMLSEMESYVKRGESFAFETTLSGKRYARLIPIWKRLGYRIDMYYLKLFHVEMAIERVKARVAQGGHSVPEDIIRRRYQAGLHNFIQIYRELVDTCLVYDNSGEQPILVEKIESK